MVLDRAIHSWSMQDIIQEDMKDVVLSCIWGYFTLKLISLIMIDNNIMHKALQALKYGGVNGWRLASQGASFVVQVVQVS